MPIVGWREVYEYLKSHPSKIVTVKDISDNLAITHDAASKFARKCAIFDSSIGKGIQNKRCFYIYIDDVH